MSNPSMSPSPNIRDTSGGSPPPSDNDRGSGAISTPHSISQAVKARKAEYTRKKTIKIKVGTWNVASVSGTEKDLGAWFVSGKGVRNLSNNLAGLSIQQNAEEHLDDDRIESVDDQESRWKKKKPTIPKGDVAGVPSGDEISLYVLGLQEIVDVSSATEALRPFTDPAPPKKWKKAMEAALPAGYEKIAEHQLIGLYILIYASAELAPSISSISTTSVGTGLMGYMGNKGAVSARIVLGETTKIVFVDCHLAAGSDNGAVQRRNWDAGQIFSRTKFDPITDGVEVTEEFGDGIGEEDFTFFFGDLNYRLDDIPGEDVRRLLLLHTRDEYDTSNASRRKIDSELGYVDVSSSDTVPADVLQVLQDEAESPLDPESDPASLHITLQSLLPHDQLREQQKQRKAFHDGWREGDINFLPTYKYDIGSVGMFDSGEKKRGPSWCDRILYRSRKSVLESKMRAEQEDEARKKDDEMKARGIDAAVSDDDVLFDYDPDTDGLVYGDEYDEDENDRADAELVQTHEEFEDAITLDYYASHQRVLSSDHKPLDAVFTLVYDSVIPELKAKVHQDVARDLDKAENEGRPAVTLVVDNHSGDQIPKTDGSAEQGDVNSVEFGDVRYGVRKYRGLTIANTGQVTATFCLIDRPVVEGQDSGVAPTWLEIQVVRQKDDKYADHDMLTEYALAPGEATNIILAIDITDLDLVYELNEGLVQIDDILVLRINNGKDHFIPVHGKWMFSCFCRSLDDLTLVPESGVRGLQQQKQEQAADNVGKKNERPISKSSSARLSAPRELFALTDAIQGLVERSLAEWEMTNGDEVPPWRLDRTGAGWPFEAEGWTLGPGPDRSEVLASVREALDTSTPIAEHFDPEIPTIVRLEVLAETLLTFVRSLRDGIITAALWTELEVQSRALEKRRGQFTNEDCQAWVLEVLSSAPVHSVAFTFVTFMLAKLANDIAPVSIASSRSSRVSTSSVRSPTPELESPVSPSQRTSGKSSVFSNPLRRRNRASTLSSSSDGVPSTPMPDLTRRRDVESAYAGIFSDIIIRTGSSPPQKDKDKRALEEKKRAILEPFLSAP